MRDRIKVSIGGLQLTITTCSVQSWPHPSGCTLFFPFRGLGLVDLVFGQVGEPGIRSNRAGLYASVWKVNFMSCFVESSSLDSNRRPVAVNCALVAMEQLVVALRTLEENCLGRHVQTVRLTWQPYARLWCAPICVLRRVQKRGRQREQGLTHELYGGSSDLARPKC